MAQMDHCTPGMRLRVAPASGARGRNEKLRGVRGSGLQTGNESCMCELHISEPTGVTFRLPLSSQIIEFSSDIII